MIRQAITRAIADQVNNPTPVHMVETINKLIGFAPAGEELGGTIRKLLMKWISR